MTELIRAQDTVLVQQMQFEADFDDLDKRISDYTVVTGKKGLSMFDGMMAFINNDPIAQLQAIKDRIEILEKGLEDPVHYSRALFDIRDLANGPVFEGYLLMGQVVGRNKDQIGSLISSVDAEERMAAVDVLARASQTVKYQEVDGTWEMIERNSEVVAIDLLGDDPNPAIVAFVEILRSESIISEASRISDKVFHYLLEKLDSGEITEDKLVQVLGGLAEYEFIAQHNKSFSSQINKFLETKDINPVDSFLAYWQREGRVEEEIRMNLERISEIERERSGITKVLHDEFGIRHFSRYSSKVLIAQYDSRDNIQTPYGIVISAQRDHNGAFRINDNNKQWDKLSKDLYGDYLFRFLEVEDGFDLVKKIRGLDKRYGKGNKISFVFFNAHANEHLVEFDEGETITTHDLVSGRGDNLRRYLTPEVVVSLISCSAGKKDDFANILAKRFGLKVIASKGIARRVTIKATDRDPIDFKVIFHYGNSRRDHDGRSNGGAVVYDYRPHMKPAV